MNFEEQDSASQTSSQPEPTTRLVSIVDGIWIGELDSYTKSLIAHDVERVIAASMEDRTAGSRFTYVYLEGDMCLLTTGGAVCSASSFAQIQNVIQQTLASEGERRIVSAPQLKAFVKGSFRAWGRDEIPRGLHYILVVKTSEAEDAPASTIQISSPGDQRGQASRSVAIDLLAGHIVVHDTALRYCILPLSDSLDPSRGLILLDGYCW